MTLYDHLFWFFAISFFGGGMLLGCYMREAAIAAIFGFLLGETLERFAQVRRYARKR